MNLTATRQIGGLDPAAARAALVPWPARAAPIRTDEYRARLDRARALMHTAGTDALLVTAGASLRDFAGIPWGASERLVALLLRWRPACAPATSR